MSQDFENIKIADYLRKKRRRAFVWGVGVTACIGGVIWGMSGSGPYPKGEQIARVDIDGVIFGDEYRDEMMNELAENDDVKAVILHINSGGGGVYASEKLYHQVRRIAQDVPVVAVLEDAAASGAYITALGADYIISAETTVTASIGVISEIPDVSKLLDKWGVGSTLVRSSETKGGISPTRTPTPEEIADREALITDLYEWFRDLVGVRRDLSGNALAVVADGGVMTGREALKAGLVDEIGDQFVAKSYLVELDDTLKGLSVQKWEPNYPLEEGGYLSAFADNIAQSMANGVVARISDMSLPQAK